MFKLILLIAFTIYGANSLSCLICSGLQCTSISFGFNSKNCTNLNDDCVTIFDNYTPIQRGCYETLGATEKTLCDSSNILCSKCHGDNCNFIGRNDQKCIDCTSYGDRTCINNPNRTGVVCPAILYDETPKCYTKAVGVQTERGCIVTASELEDCLDDTTHCLLCDLTTGQTSCNSYVFPTDRRVCKTCATNTCGISEQSIYCDDAHDDCAEINYFGRKKKCQSDLTEDEVTYCQDHPNRCAFCTTNNCNAVNVTFPKVQCLKCDSSQNTNCITSPNGTAVTQCSDGCVTYLKNVSNNLITERGCFESLTSSQKSQCDIGFDSSNNNCRKCQTDNCNTGLHPSNRLSCYTCNSGLCESITNAKISYANYYNQNDQCVTIIAQNTIKKLTFASLLSETDKKNCENDPTCMLSYCKTQNCNNPANFIKSVSCLQCDSSTHGSDCLKKPESLVALPCTSSTDFCYTHVEGSKLTRGCLSQLTQSEIINCIANGATCEICRDSSGCNSQIFPPNRRTCHQCNSGLKSDCNEALTSDAELCVNYDPNNKCYAIVTNNGTVIRTCSNNKEATCKDTRVCEECNENGCNFKKLDTNSSSSKIILNSCLLIFLIFFLSFFK